MRTETPLETAARHYHSALLRTLSVAQDRSLSPEAKLRSILERVSRTLYVYPELPRADE